MAGFDARALRRAQAELVLGVRKNTRKISVPAVRRHLPYRTGRLRGSVRVVKESPSRVAVHLGGWRAPYWRYVPAARAMVYGRSSPLVKADLARARGQVVAAAVRQFDHIVQGDIRRLWNGMQAASFRNAGFHVARTGRNIRVSRST